VATNASGAFTADIEAFIADEVLPLARRQLVAYQFGDPLTLPEGRGFVYTAVRYNRIPLPFAALSEGVPPIGESMTVSTVTVTATQWGDKVTITDQAELTTKHPLMKVANDLVGLQVGETLERNTFNTLMSGTQVNFVNSRGSRASLQAGDVLDPTTVIRTVAALKTLGAPRYMGDEMTDEKISAEQGGARASDSPRKMPHYAGIMHTLVVGDFRQNPQVINAWSYSDLNRLYNYEAGEWGGARWCDTNMVPTFTGVASATATGFASGGALPSGTYAIQVTGSDTQNQYESRILQVTTGVVVGGSGAGSIQVTTPATAGFTWNVYISVAGSTTMANLAACASGPTVGPLAGQATQLAGSTTVTLTAVGTAQVPPSAPATGVTVYPTFVLGRGFYGQVKLRDVQITWLDRADKSDPLNQLRVIGWKTTYGTIVLNQNFGARIESASAFTSTFG
jgi:N4-gp56 family major capsid protein